ncbi:OmpA family protein [Chryseolinea sp. H1M3-3]|uniref:OmpA family protein n=1 Tax=Chryseolinea sp. H1M3-3 TaxID=3034144 RepID=UPI0023EBB8B0|nr:OmpA family protein [Chryseolinea sp. H1M3-3]
MRNTAAKHMAALTMLIAILSQILMGCNATNTTKGGAIGAGVGGAIGGAIGHRSDNTVVGAIIGATVGGAAGAIIGRQMDKQAEELKRDLEGAHVERVGEGILITFESGLVFDTESYSLRENTKTNLTDLSETLKKYDDTNILIEGHTDNKGEDAYNQKLSENRADAVENFLVGQGIKDTRITTKGYGEGQPLDSNESEAGRQKNRRVEVAIYANKEMKRLAKKGELGESE